MIIITLFHHPADGQKQLILLKGENVLLRLYPGDEFVYRLKNSKSIKRTYVNNLSDTSVVTHRDTVPFYKIDRIYAQRITRGNIMGTALVFGGAALFLIDQLNVSVLQGNDFSFDRGISRVSIAGLAIGLPLMLIKKKSQKLNYKYRLLTVKPGSIFYRPDSKGFSSPYIDN
jgi:hypothetical protein